MTQEEYKAAVAEIDGKINALSFEISTLVEQKQAAFHSFVREHALPIGTKVLVRLGSKEAIAFIASIQPHYTHYRKSGFRYNLNKPKKDGTMSAVSAGIYGYDSIEKID